MVDVMERGNVYFFYRPRVEEKDPESLDDVQRMYMILEPHGKSLFRRFVIGQKKLPDVEDGGDTYWAFVDDVESDATSIRDDLEKEEYETKTRGTREQPAARPAGEGVYALVKHEDHTHFAFVRELPETAGPVQKAMNVLDEASYVMSVKNPEKGSPRAVGLGEDQEAEFPRHLEDRFEDRRFIAVDPPEFLDHEGAEILLIGASRHVEEELDVRLNAQHEDEQHAEIINNLHLAKQEFPRDPLLSGEWA